MTPCPAHEHRECEDCMRRTREDNTIALETWQEKERMRETIRRLNERATKAEGRALRLARYILAEGSGFSLVTSKEHEEIAAIAGETLGLG